MYCKHCGAEIKGSEAECPSCGEPLPKLTFCQACGRRIPPDVQTCPECGATLVPSVQAPGLAASNLSGAPNGITINNVVQNSPNLPPRMMLEPKVCHKWTAFLLCLFLGWAGAHRFYEGNVALGILYLFTGGLFFIGWIVDIFRILGKPSTYYPKQ